MTSRCFVAGSPVAHSRSPLIHGFWLDAHGLDATYERIETKPGDLVQLMERVRSGEFLGGNLTVPLKEAVLPHLDRLTPAALAMGAVNTVFMQDGYLTGANTDVPGFFASLDQAVAGWDAQPRKVLLIGAGGAARAILHGLGERNISLVTIANRSRERAEALLPPHGSSPLARYVVAEWPLTEAVLDNHDVIINATSLGMAGQPALELAWPDRLAGTIVIDIVYVPLVTPFLDEAAKRGAITVDGLGMLLHQASLAFVHWFGIRPVVTPALRSLIEADLLPKPDR